MQQLDECTSIFAPGTEVSPEAPTFSPQANRQTERHFSGEIFASGTGIFASGEIATERCFSTGTFRLRHRNFRLGRKRNRILAVFFIFQLLSSFANIFKLVHYSSMK
ncbi:unnamed protein product [Trifolium pratense]|uniref:Uncharacterized protein n=1 Tax=Trifolium pratense TaxID=57577 RepID=A0ACB0L8C9_TRIPR|nr:unnamed protein product [Trifolium pratense]